MLNTAHCIHYFSCSKSSIWSLERHDYSTRQATGGNVILCKETVMQWVMMGHSLLMTSRKTDLTHVSGVTVGYEELFLSISDFYTCL